MYFETVVWYNPGNRFALIEPSDGRQAYLVQLEPEQAIAAPLMAGQCFEIQPHDVEDVTKTQSMQLTCTNG
jgi:hypothetical protein